MNIHKMTNKQLYAECYKRYPEMFNAERKSVVCPYCSRTWTPVFLSTLVKGTCDPCNEKLSGAVEKKIVDPRDAKIAWFVSKGIPANYAAIVCESEPAQIFCVSTRRRMKPHLSALISGQPGRGKTTLALRIMAWRLTVTHRGKKAIFATAYGICQEYEGAGRRNTSNEQTRDRITAKYSSVPWLCIDDWSSTDMAHWETERLFGIINNRTNKSLPTVITSQYGHYGFGETFNARGKDVLSRIGEHGCFIEITGPDLRRVENE